MRPHGLFLLSLLTLMLVPDLLSLCPQLTALYLSSGRLGVLEVLVTCLPGPLIPIVLASRRCVGDPFGTGWPGGKGGVPKMEPPAPNLSPIVPGFRPPWTC